MVWNFSTLTCNGIVSHLLPRQIISPWFLPFHLKFEIAMNWNERVQWILTFYQEELFTVTLNLIMNTVRHPSYGNVNQIILYSEDP